ncbi:endothelin-converting enzyme homolog [Haemaphysalis longicornis]
MKLELDATWARDLAYHWAVVLVGFFLMCLAPTFLLWLQINVNAYCDEAPCAAIGHELRRSLELRVDPCDDFYSFVCGRWERTNVPFSDRASQHTARFRRRLEAAMLHSDTRGQGAVEKAAKLYTACRYRPFDDACQLKPLESLLADLNITWPFSEQQASGLANLTVMETLFKAQLRHGLDVLYEGGVAVSSVRQKRHLVLRIGRLLGRPDPELNVTQIRSAVVSLARLLGSEKDDYGHLAELVVKQEEKLEAFVASGTAADEEKLVTFNEAKYKFPGYKWTQLAALVNHELGMALKSYHYLYINGQAAAAATSALEEGAAAHAFIGWRLVRLLAPMGCGQAGLEIAHAAGGDVDLVSDSLAAFTLDRLQQYAPMAAAAPYVERETPGESREDLQWYLTRLMQNLQEGIHSSAYVSWKFDSTASKLAKKFRLHLLYPDYVHVDVQVDRLYRYMPDFQGDCLNMTLTLLRAGSRQRHQALGKTVALYGDGWDQPQTAVESLYSIEFDELFVPLGAVSAPLYTRGAPAAWKLGALGSVVAREVMGKVLALAAASGNYTPPGVDCFPNGSLVHAFATRQTLAAYAQAVTDGGAQLRKQRLRGFERFNDLQLLFVASCFTLCEADQDAPLGKALCNEPLRNNEQFAYAFECPSGSPMNPEKRCDL